MSKVESNIPQVRKWVSTAAAAENFQSTTGRGPKSDFLTSEGMSAGEEEQNAAATDRVGCERR